MTEELPGTLVLGISHVNQGFIRSSIVPTKQPATLRDQVKHKIELLDELNAKYKLDEGKVKLSIVAHSIGSWISLGVRFSSRLPHLNHLDLTTRSNITSDYGTASDARYLLKLPLPDLVAYCPLSKWVEARSAILASAYQSFALHDLFPVLFTHKSIKPNRRSVNSTR